MGPLRPKAKPAHVRSHVGYWGDERNCYKWDPLVAVETHSGHSCARLERPQELHDKYSTETALS